MLLVRETRAVSFRGLVKLILNLSFILVLWSKIRKSKLINQLRLLFLKNRILIF